MPLLQPQSRCENLQTSGALPHPMVESAQEERAIGVPEFKVSKNEGTYLLPKKKSTSVETRVVLPWK